MIFKYRFTSPINNYKKEIEGEGLTFINGISTNQDISNFILTISDTASNYNEIKENLKSICDTMASLYETNDSVSLTIEIYSPIKQSYIELYNFTNLTYARYSTQIDNESTTDDVHITASLTLIESK